MDQPANITATDIPTRHKAGIWGGGIISIIALIIGIVALVLALVYYPRARGSWDVVSVGNSGDTSIAASNRTLYGVNPSTTGSTTVTATITGTSPGDIFGIYNNGVGVGVGNVLVAVARGGPLSIPPGTAVQFVASSDGLVPFYDLPVSSST